MLHKRKDTEKTDMLSGPMMKKILTFALPLAASGILQQLFTSADMAVVFWFDGSVAQSAVNSNGALVNLLINLFTGLSVGSTVTIAEYIGRKRTEDIHSMVFTSMVIALISGVILLGVGIGVAQPLLKLMKTPAEALPLATQYLRIYFIGMPFLMIFDFGAAILRSVGDTKRALLTLLITGVLNVGLNFLFVAAFKMSVVGVALATVTANFVCAVLAVIFIMKNGMLRISFKKSKLRAKYVKRIFSIGIPAGLQGVVFSIANVLIQTAINGFGSQAVAGNGDAVNFEYYVYYFISAFAQATVTFFGQNYAAGEYGRCKRIVRLNLITSLAVSSVLSVVFTLGGKLFIRVYTTDEVAIEFALVRMKCVLLGSMLPCFYEITGGALRSMGHSLLPAVLTVVGSCVLRIIWIYSVFAVYGGYWLLLLIYPISWVVTGGSVTASYLVISRKAFKRGETSSGGGLDAAAETDSAVGADVRDEAEIAPERVTADVACGSVFGVESNDTCE